MEEIEILTKQLNQMEKNILDDHTKDTAKELTNFIKTKQKVAMLSKQQKYEKQTEDFNSPIIKDNL